MLKNGYSVKNSDDGQYVLLEGKFNNFEFITDSNGNPLIENGAPVFKVNKKITSTAFPALVWKDPFAKPGDKMLELLGMLEYSEIEKIYQLRGGVAERLANEYIKKVLKEDTVTFNKEDIGYDNFHYVPSVAATTANHKYKYYKLFGGMIDIATKFPERIVNEVKGKGIADYKKVMDNRSSNEEYQAQFLAFLANTERYRMVYVFFTKQQEEMILNGRDSAIKLDDVKIELKEYKVDEKEMIQLLKEASAYYTKVFSTKKIPFEDFTASNYIKLGLGTDMGF